MLFTSKKIYSKRYTPAAEAIAALMAENELSDYTINNDNDPSIKTYHRYLNPQNYAPIPGIEEKSQRFIALAKKFSQDYEIDIDILEQTHSIQVNLLLYHTDYNSDMKRTFTQLFDMCDSFCTLPTKYEPTDFTLSLTLKTHEFHPQD